MASEAGHLAAANLNQKTLAHLCQDVSVHGPWVAVVAFYKALQIVEAVFANDPDIRHCTDHGSRERALKKKPKYLHINITVPDQLNTIAQMRSASPPGAPAKAQSS